MRYLHRNNLRQFYSQYSQNNQESRRADHTNTSHIVLGDDNLRTRSSGLSNAVYRIREPDQADPAEHHLSETYQLRRERERVEVINKMDRNDLREFLEDTGIDRFKNPRTRRMVYVKSKTVKTDDLRAYVLANF